MGYPLNYLETGGPLKLQSFHNGFQASICHVFFDKKTMPFLNSKVFAFGPLQIHCDFMTISHKFNYTFMLKLWNKIKFIVKMCLRKSKCISELLDGNH
uniref:Uncharacterized protein n=1 Tax=Arundo donax TaxID=35708 RepID=A0A0A9AJX2_ARUDO